MRQDFTDSGKRARRRLAMASAAGAAALTLTAMTPQDAAASERWRYDSGRSGAIARSCGGEGAFTGCSALRCGRDGRMVFSLEQVSRGADFGRRGSLVSGSLRDRIEWREEVGPRGRSYVAEGLDLGAALYALKRNREMVVVFNPNAGFGAGTMRFTLRGSSAAIGKLEDDCARRADLGRAVVPPSADLRSAPTSRWSYTERGRNAAASSCGAFGPRQREICAVVYCRRGRGIEFGLEGLDESNDAPRRGVIALNRDRDVVFALKRGPDGRDDRIWTADLPNPDRFAERLKRGDRVDVLIEPRRRPLSFTLRGSSRAISLVQERCEEVAERREERREERGLTSRPNRIVARYEEEVIGRWGVDRYSCRGGGWVFDPASLTTPDGAVCQRVQLAEVTSGALAGAVAVRGVECRGGSRARLGQTREFELLRQGERLAMRTVERKTIKAGNLTIQLGAQERFRELVRCRR